MTAAEPGDTLQIEPGVYEEAIALKDGVSLVARVPGTVVLTAGSSVEPWVGITADGRLGNRISGIVLRGRPDAPLAVGMRLSGHDLAIDDVTVEGSIVVGMEIVNDGAITVRASRFTNIAGLPLRIGAGARPEIRQNLFVYSGAAPSPAAEIAPDAAPRLSGNLFAGYANVLAGSSGPERSLDGNFTIRPERAQRPGPRPQ